MANFRIFEGSLQERFQASRSDIQMFGGGFGNGKTSNAVIKALQLCKDYPGSNGIIARSTLPKLNDTIRKEFIKWCPSAWIKNFPRPEGKSSTCTLKNGTVVNFRYIVQQGKSEESSTSNLLSATYDWAVIDQVEDPEIEHKDLLDLAGRMRGSARYIGDDPTMPRIGPGWMILTCNPTRNWVYKKLVKPLHLYLKTGMISEDLIVDPKTGRVMIELYEGSTYENADNLPPDFITRQEAMYKGVMRDRYLLGQWGGFEGLVYPQWNDEASLVEREQIQRYHAALLKKYKVAYVESFDHGVAVPSCYEFAFVDHVGNVVIADGFHEAMLGTTEIIKRIKDIRKAWTGYDTLPDAIQADPAIFRRQGGVQKTVGPSTADLLYNGGAGLRVVRANNDVLNGIIKVQTYLTKIPGHKNPFSHEFGAPYLYVNRELTWFDDEIADYYWKKDTSGEPLDQPRDVKDHAMDGTRYLLTKRPTIAGVIPVTPTELIATMRWHEQNLPSNFRKARYG